ATGAGSARRAEFGGYGASPGSCLRVAFSANLAGPLLDVLRTARMGVFGRLGAFGKLRRPGLFPGAFGPTGKAERLSHVRDVNANQGGFLWIRARTTCLMSSSAETTRPAFLSR